MKVSVIIPVYNTGKYLNRCLESVLNQTYPRLEVILIDDGSTDGSSVICDEFSQRASWITVIHQNNSGLSAARNAGIDIATGEYITFLDSDDYFASDFFEKAVNLCELNDADIAIMQMLYISQGTNHEIKKAENTITRIMASQQAIEESLYQKLFSCCIPGKLYKREIFDAIRFPIGKLSEDLATCHLIFDAAKKIAYSNEIGYYYRQHDTSIMHTFNPRRMDALEWANEIEQFCRKNYPEIVPAAICRKFNVAVHLLLELPENGPTHEEYFDIIWLAIKQTRLKTIVSTKIRFREKAAAILSFLGEKNLKKIWNSRIAVKRNLY